MAFTFMLIYLGIGVARDIILDIFKRVISENEFGLYSTTYKKFEMFFSNAEFNVSEGALNFMTFICLIGITLLWPLDLLCDVAMIVGIVKSERESNN